MWLSRLRTQHSVWKDVGWIPGLIQWVKDRELLRAGKWAPDGAQICLGVGGGAAKKKKKKKKEREKQKSI